VIATWYFDAMHVKWEKQIPPKNTACQLLRIELAGRSRENFRLSHNPLTLIERKALN
jgi:hypothetical protein